MDISILGRKQVPIAVLNSFNSIAVIILVPVMELLIYPCLRKINHPPTLLQRMGEISCFVLYTVDRTPLQNWKQMLWKCLIIFYMEGYVKVMVFHTTFNNISVISWRSVLLVEETGIPRENHRRAVSQWQTLSHNDASSTPRLIVLQYIIDISLQSTNHWHSNFSTTA